MRLTRAVVAGLKLPAGKSEIIVFDEDLPGFGLRIRAGGKRTWVAQYRVGPNTRRLTIGSRDNIEPEDARKLAKAALAKAQLGNDPQAEKAEARARAALTLSAVADHYLRHARGRLRPRSFDVLVDGQKVAAESQPQSSVSKFYEKEYLIPAELMRHKDKLTVRFEATNGLEVTPVFGVRLITR
jgi:hypothetical protein